MGYLLELNHKSVGCYIHGIRPPIFIKATYILPKSGRGGCYVAIHLSGESPLPRG